MAVFTTIAFAAFLLENDHLVALHEGLEDFSRDRDTFHGRCTDFNVAVGIQQEDLVESDLVASLEVVAEMVDIQILAFFSFELQSLDFYDSVHCTGV